MSNLPKSSPRGRRFLLGFFICGLAICNFATPLVLELGPAGPSSPLVLLIAVLIGSMAGQCGLLAIWSVLGPGRLLIRLPLTLLFAAILATAVTAGISIVAGPMDAWRDSAPLLMFLPLILLATQLPLWGLKLATGGRIVRVGVNTDQSAILERQFGLQHLLGATVVVAVALSLAGSGLRLLGSGQGEDWIPLLFGCLLCTLWSAFATPPCIWAALSAKKKDAAALAVGIYTVLMTMLLVGILELLSSGAMPGEVAVMILAFHISLMAVILGTLHVARHCGYMFISQRRPQPVIETGCPFAVQDDPSEGLQPAEPPTPIADEPPDSAGHSV